jgi:hypothetical protein
VANRLIALLLLAVVVVPACGGGPDTSSVTSRARAELLASFLPSELGRTELRKEAFSGSAWLKASPETAFSPEVSVDAATFLEELRKPSSDLTVAWALSGEGPKVVGYRVVGTSAKALVDAYVDAIRAEADPTTISVTRRVLSGKTVTVTSRGLPSARGYLYAKDDMLFTAWTGHITSTELAELLQQLP